MTTTIEQIAPKTWKATTSKGPQGFFGSEASAKYWAQQIQSGHYPAITEKMQ